MSGEFFSELNENSIEVAVEYMENTMRSFDDVTEYAIKIHETYELLPDGELELGKMITAAQYVINREPDDMDEEVQAIYFGELLGLEFVNYLKPDDGLPFKSGYAESFIQYQIALDILSEKDPECNSERDQLSRLSKSIQYDLSQPMEEHGLNPIYEEFGKKATSKLSHDSSHQELAMMGFRMIVTEALKPSPTAAPKTIAELENEYVPSIEETEEIIGEQEGINFIEWENISYVRKNIYNKYTDITTSDEDEQLSNLSTLVSYDRHVETRLMSFALENDLIGKDDLLSVRGEFFGISDTGASFFYGKNTEVRGVFDGIHIIETLPKRYIPKFADPDNKADIKHYPKNPIQSVALRIINPLFIYKEINDDKEKPHRNDERTIDIPLNYKNVELRRIKAEELEPEA